MRRLSFHFGIFAVLMLLLSRPSYGQGNTCSARPLPSKRAELLEPHSAVFSGKVIEIMAAHVHDVIRFEVHRSWKGVDAKEAVVSIAFAGYKGVKFELGETYLVFASGEGDDLRVNSCSRTKKLAAAGPEVQLLDKPGASTESQRQMERAQRVDEFLHSGPWSKDAKSLLALRKFAPLKGELILTSTPWQQVDPKPEARLLQFDGLDLAGEVDGNDFKLRAITVTSPHWQLLHGLNVGSPASQIREALDLAPQPITGPTETVSGEAGTVRFSIQDGRIVKVAFTLLF